jgi:hypothetical protein
VGIIFACDGTKLQKGSKAGCWLLMFTVSILNQKMCNLPIAWKSLGYIFDLSIIQSQADAKGQSQDLKAEHIHAIFKVVLATFIDAHKEGVLENVSLTFGHHTKRVNLKLVCFFVIGDMQHCTMRSCMRPPYRVPVCLIPPPHVLSIVDIYLSQPVIPRSSFYSPRAPKCLFRQD